MSRKLHTAGEQLNRAFPAALALAVLLTVAQLWGHIHWLWMNQCKFPDDCWVGDYLRAFSALTPNLVRRPALHLGAVGPLDPPAEHAPRRKRDPGTGPNQYRLSHQPAGFHRTVVRVMVATVYGWIVSVAVGTALGSVVPALRRRSKGLLVAITSGSAVVSVILGTLALATYAT